MPDRKKFYKSLLKHNIDEKIIGEIINIPYIGDENPGQDNANFFCAALNKCDKLVRRDALADVMCDMSCRADKKTLKASKKFAKAHAQEPFGAKLDKLEHIEKPRMIGDNRIAAHIAGEGEAQCSCACLKGRRPENGAMPVSYCYCCAGSLKQCYETTLGVKLKVAGMSSFLNNGERCSAVFEIVK